VLRSPSSDTLGDVVGNLSQTMQQHISIAQQDAVMMVVRVPYFPEHISVRVGFQDYTALKWKPARKLFSEVRPL